MAKKEKPKILFWDIETTSIDILHRTYDLKVFVKRFKPDEIVRDWTILCIAWAYDDDPPKCISVTPNNIYNDAEVVRYFHGILSEADYVCGHNIDNFDVKKFNARAIQLGLEPVIISQQIDTLKILRKYFKFTSNKLSYACKYLGIDQKDESPDWDLILSGDREELSKCRKYCKQDVVAVRALYHKIKAWHKTHPDMNIVNPVRDVSGLLVKPVCPVCCSANTKKKGFRYQSKTKKQRFLCLDCNFSFAGKKVIDR